MVFSKTGTSKFLLIFSFEVMILSIQLAESNTSWLYLWFQSLQSLSIFETKKQFNPFLWYHFQIGNWREFCFLLWKLLCCPIFIRRHGMYLLVKNFELSSDFPALMEPRSSSQLAFSHSISKSYVNANCRTINTAYFMCYTKKIGNLTHNKASVTI